MHNWLGGSGFRIVYVPDIAIPVLTGAVAAVSGLNLSQLAG